MPWRTIRSTRTSTVLLILSETTTPTFVVRFRFLASAIPFLLRPAAGFACQLALAPHGQEPREVAPRGGHLIRVLGLPGARLEPELPDGVPQLGFLPAQLLRTHVPEGSDLRLLLGHPSISSPTPGARRSASGRAACGTRDASPPAPPSPRRPPSRTAPCPASRRRPTPRARPCPCPCGSRRASS